MDGVAAWGREERKMAYSWHLQCTEEFEARVGEWIEDLSNAQNLSFALQQMETAMVAATFNTFADADAQAYFETRALPMYVCLWGVSVLPVDRSCKYSTVPQALLT